MMRRILLSILGLLLIIGILGGIKALQIRTLIAGAKQHAQPAESVAVVEVRRETWPVTLSAIASLAAVQGVTVMPDIPGTVTEVAFESGAEVKKGDLLVKLDTSAEEAQLKAIAAQVGLAKVDLGRIRSLREQQMISQAELDTAEATLKQAEANALAVRATIEKKLIRAPFDGKLGIRQVNLGQYLENGKPIVSLQALAPIYANFSLPQQELPKLGEGMEVRLTVDAYTNRSFKGVLTAMNPDLNAATRSIGLQATFPNTDRLLRPGMFARTEVVLPDAREVLVLPRTAILSAPYGDSVYVLEERARTTNGAAGLVVRQQFVRAGAIRGDFIAVEGIKAGEKVVSTGAFKLRNGMAVVVNDSLDLHPTGNPKPADS